MSVPIDRDGPGDVAGAAEGHADGVTYAFGDPDRELHGLARVALSPDGAGGVTASGMALLFAGVELVAARTAGGLPASPGEEGFGAARAAGVATGTREPLQAWDVAFSSEDGRAGFALRFEATAAPVEVDPLGPLAVMGGVGGFEQLCRVTGLATVDGQAVAVSGLGSRSRSWGATDWTKVASTRTAQAWLGEDLAISVSAVRPVSARSHADEAVAGGLVLPDPDGGAPLAQAAAEATISTTYDAEGRPRGASLEAYLDPDDFPERAAGAVLCGTSLDLGELRLECSFFGWAMEGRRGVGRFDVLRRLAP